MRKAIIKTAILTLLLIPLMSSCKIGKKYTRPELNLPEAIDPAVTDSASVKDFNPFVGSTMVHVSMKEFDLHIFLP